jgi:hypothetical protein
MTQEWNPEEAGAELKALFDKADKILSKPIYQNISADELETPSADAQTIAANETIGVTQS